MIKNKNKWCPMNNGELTKRTPEEETENGRVEWSVYSTFVTSAYKGALAPVIILYHVLFQAIKHGYSKNGTVPLSGTFWVLVSLGYCYLYIQSYPKFFKKKKKILLFHFFFWIFQKNK